MIGDRGGFSQEEFEQYLATGQMTQAQYELQEAEAQRRKFSQNAVNWNNTLEQEAIYRAKQRVEQAFAAALHKPIVVDLYHAGTAEDNANLFQSPTNKPKNKKLLLLCPSH